MPSPVTPTFFPTPMTTTRESLFFSHYFLSMSLILPSSTALNLLLLAIPLSSKLSSLCMRIFPSHSIPAFSTGKSKQAFLSTRVVFTYVPNDEPPCRSILQRCHDHGTASHPGYLKTCQHVMVEFWWPGLASYIHKYVEGCTTCQQNKTNTHSTVPLLTPKQVNQEVEMYLQIFYGKNPGCWADNISHTEFAHNHCPHSITNQSPFYLMMGYKPRALSLVISNMVIPAIETHLKTFSAARNEALATHELARQVMAACICCSFSPFKLGDKVWLRARNLKCSIVNLKFAPK